MLQGTWRWRWPKWMQLSGESMGECRVHGVEGDTACISWQRPVVVTCKGGRCTVVAVELKLPDDFGGMMCECQPPAAPASKPLSPTVCLVSE